MTGEANLHEAVTIIHFRLMFVLAEKEKGLVREYV